MMVGVGVASGFSCLKLDAESLPNGHSGLGVWTLIQGREDSFDGVFRGKVGRIDGEARKTRVERVPVSEAELRGCRVLENRAGNVLKHAAVEEGREGGVQKDGEGTGGLLKQEPVRQAFRGAAAQCEDRIGASQSRGQRRGFESAEVRLAVTGEELRDGGAGTCLKMCVKIEEGPAGARGEETSNGRFARAHEAG